ncbi:MAG: hypothetical protein JXA20_14225 [Spirochaetes bacterium]|nr:hypothetical protein [Spirochaetota bacterium]
MALRSALRGVVAPVTAYPGLHPAGEGTVGEGPLMVTVPHLREVHLSDLHGTDGPDAIVTEKAFPGCGRALE